ncbi:MAG TPA: transcriptional regulator [Thermoanaerobaculia bacterium]|nr:transcriptional regulator [Thermoanaerobaculia bacterium]
MSNPANRLREFGEFRIDLRKGLLLDRGQPVSIPPKAFETLIALVDSDGAVLSKEELMAKVWGETFVEENNLTQQISLLRKLLRDTDQTYIETVPRRGYRFAATVRDVAEVTRTYTKELLIAIAVVIAVASIPIVRFAW